MVLRATLWTQTSIFPLGRDAGANAACPKPGRKEVTAASEGRNPVKEWLWRQQRPAGRPSRNSHLHLTLWWHRQHVSFFLTPSKTNATLQESAWALGRGEACQALQFVPCRGWKVPGKPSEGTTWDGHPSEMAFTLLPGKTGCGGPPQSLVPVRSLSSHCGSDVTPTNIHSCQCTAQPGGAFCKQQPCFLPWQRPAAASQAHLSQKAHTGGSCSG